MTLKSSSYLLTKFSRVPLTIVLISKISTMVNGTLLNFGKRYEDNFDQWPKLHLGLDALSNQKILNGIYYVCKYLVISMSNYKHWSWWNPKIERQIFLTFPFFIFSGRRHDLSDWYAPTWWVNMVAWKTRFRGRFLSLWVCRGHWWQSAPGPQPTHGGHNETEKKFNGFWGMKTIIFKIYFVSCVFTAMRIWIFHISRENINAFRNVSKNVTRFVENENLK